MDCEVCIIQVKGKGETMRNENNKLTPEQVKAIENNVASFGRYAPNRDEERKIDEARMTIENLKS